MKTIIKGKNVKLNYEFKPDFLNHHIFWENDYCSQIIYRKQKEINSLEYGRIFSKQEITYETYFESEKIVYRLNVGEKFDEDIIESIEGTPEGDIIYYTNKQLHLDINIEMKNKIIKEINNRIDELKLELGKTLRKLESEELKYNKILESNESEIIQEAKCKKWYEF